MPERTALREVFATTREQRCWVHKTMNVLNAMPKSIQAKAKAHLHDIWQAETKAKANVAFDFFVETYGVKWDKAVAKLVKHRDAPLTFYDYPAEHWKHIRTSNPIESVRASPRTCGGHGPHSPPSVIEPNAPRDVSAARPVWQWPSS